MEHLAEIREFVIGRYNYWIYILLMMIGFYGMVAKNNLVKKLIGMTIFQTSIILFYISTGVKGEKSTIPILLHEAGGHAHGPAAHTINPDLYANPLPHVLMLTAIVVGVSTLAVGLALIQKIYREYGTLEEDEILEKMH